MQLVVRYLAQNAASPSYDQALQCAMTACLEAITADPGKLGGTMATLTVLCTEGGSVLASTAMSAALYQQLLEMSQQSSDGDDNSIVPDMATRLAYMGDALIGLESINITSWPLPNSLSPLLKCYWKLMVCSWCCRCLAVLALHDGAAAELYRNQLLPRMAATAHEPRWQLAAGLAAVLIQANNLAVSSSDMMRSNCLTADTGIHLRISLCPAQPSDQNGALMHGLCCRVLMVIKRNLRLPH